ncbi:hypothetical protein lerEdw1_010543 [Lerista edwardsae]|nr:hypothetical protein lerEdw1_010543 [Lerista edwardsae]
MNPVETEEIASIQNNTAVQVPNMVEISTVDSHTVTDLTIVPRIITTTSEATTIPQNHTIPTLEKNTTALGETTSSAGHRDHVTFGKNHISISKDSSKSTSGDAVGSHWKFSTVAKDAILDPPRNVDSTKNISNISKNISKNISSKEYVTELSSGDNVTSAIKEAKTVLGNITTDDACYPAPGNMATDEDNTDNTITATPEVHCIPTIVLEDVCNAPALSKMGPVPGDMSNVTLEDKLNNSVSGGGFSALSVGDTAIPATSLGSTTVFVETHRNKSPEDYTIDKGGITVVPADDINSADSFSDSGEVFQTSFKETYPIGSEAMTVLSEGVTDNLSTVDTSTISNTFSAMFQLPSTVVSGNTISLSDDNNTAVKGLYETSGSGSRPIKTDSDSIEVSCSPSATTITSLENLSNASTDSNLNTSENMTPTASVESTQYVSTTGNGNTFAITVGENATTSGHITAIHLETAPFNVIPGNVTCIASARGTTTANPKNMAIAPGRMQTMTAMEITTNPGNASTAPGETATILSSGDVIMMTIPSKEAILDSENSTITMTPSSITAFGNPKATRYITDAGSGDSTTREDTIADAPGSANQMESAYGKDTNVISGEILSTALIKTFEETTAIVSSQENTSNFLPVGAKPTATQGNTFSDMNKNVNNCGSSIVPEDEVGTTSDNNTTIGDKATIVDFGDIVVSAIGETVATSQNIISLVPNYVTTIVSNQDTIGTSAKREPPETITGKTTTGFRDATTIPGDTATTDVTDTIPTDTIASFDSKAPSDAIVLVSGGVTATSGPAAHISSFSREIKTNALEDATSIGTSDHAFINSEGISSDTPEKICYGERVISAYSEATTILGHISTADSSFSTGTTIQETNTGPEGITTGSTTNIPEGTQPREAFACMHSEISAGSEDVSNFSETNIFDACTTAETTAEKASTGNAASSTEANDIWCESSICPVTIGTQNITDAAPLNISLISDISVVSESSTIPELTHAKHTTTQSIYTAFATGDTANVTTSVDTNKTSATKSREVTVPETPSASGDYAQKTTLLRDVTTIAAAATTGTTATVIALGNTLMTTQAFSDDITTVSGDKSTTILEKTPKPSEIVTSEKVAPAILGDTRIHGGILLRRTRSPGDTLILEDACDLVVPKETLSSDPSGYGTTVITTDSSVTAADTINTLNDTFSAHDNVTFIPRIIISSEEILTSSNDSIPVGISIQNQTTTTEVPMGIPDKASFATGANATTINIHEARAVHSVTADTTEGMFTTVSGVTDPAVSPSMAASIPCDTTTSALGETVTIKERFSSGKVNSMTTPLGEASTESHSLTESITSTGSFSILSNVLHENAECIGESVTSNPDTISTLEDTSRLPETNISFGNSMTHANCLQETNMPTATEDIIRSGAMTSILISQDHSIITFAPADDTTSRTNINDCRGDIAINAAKYSHNTSEASVMSAGDNTTGPTVEKYIITATKPSGDITAIAGDTVSGPGDNATDVDVPRDTATTLVLEDIHTTTIGDNTSPENRIKFRKAPGSILEFTSTQCESSISGHIRSNEETMFETPSTPMINLATRETFGTDFSKADMNTGEMTADEVTNTVNDTVTACRRNSTSASRDSISNPESITTSGETLMSGQITTVILEDTGNQNVSSAFEIITFPGETAKTAVNFMAGVNVDTNASNVTSRPCTPKEDAILILRDAVAPVTVASEAVIAYRQISSPRKSTDVSSSPTYLDDSIIESSTGSGQITHLLSTVISVPCSGGTAKEVPNIETKDGIAEIQTPEITTSPEETLLSCIVIASEEVKPMAITSNSGQSLTSGMPVISEKYANPEATLGEITFPGVITAPEETFASKGTASFIEAPISPSVSDTSVASTYEVTISQADISILDNTFSSRQTAASQTSSSSKCILLPANEDTTAITTNSTSSPGEITPGNSGRPDEEVTSGNVNIIDFGSEALNPKAMPDPAEVLIVEEIAANASGDSNTPESTTHFPENAATTLAEDAAIVFGKDSTTSENPINNTTLGKSNYNSSRDTPITMQGTLNLASEKTPIAKPKGTTGDNMTENTASTPWQLKTAPKDNLIIAQEESTTATSGKITDASTETSASVSGELLATPERILTAISEETNIAILEETMDPTTRGTSIALDDTIEISLGEMTIAISYEETPETTDTTGDAMDQSDATTYEDDSTASEDTLIDVSCSVNTTEATNKETPTSVDEATTIIHRNKSKILRVTMSEASPARNPTTVSAKAITIHREASPGVATGNIPIVHLPKETFKAVSEKFTSMFQGRNNTLNPVASPPYWFILFLGILLMMVLVVVGLCMVI